MVERVALVSPYDYAKHGGVTEHVRQLAAQLRRRELDVTVLAPSSEPAVDEPGLLSLGTVMQIPINGSVARTTISPVMLEKAGALLARTRYDVIHLHEPLAPMLPLSMLNASPSAPNVGTFHASGERSLAYASSRRLLGWLAQRLAVRVAVSPQAAAFARRYIGGEYTIIPNGVETDRFRPTGPLFAEWHAGPPTLLFVGRFEEPRKGFAVLLEAFAHLQRTRPDVRLLVVGRGDPAPFQARASELELRNIHFAGPASADELPRYYRSADVLCAPSTGQESFGIILVEAMSSGLPIVAADIPGYAGVMTHRQEGLLVPPSNPDAFAAALLHLLPTVRCACAARPRGSLPPSITPGPMSASGSLTCMSGPRRRSAGQAVRCSLPPGRAARYSPRRRHKNDTLLRCRNPPQKRLSLCPLPVYNFATTLSGMTYKECQIC